MSKVLASLLIPILLLSGLLVSPASAASSWSKPRPLIDTDYFETIGNAQTDGVASVGMGVEIWKYVNYPVGYADYLKFHVSAFANTREGIQYGVGSLSYNWYTVSNPTGITGDDDGTWLNLPFPVLHYGVEYTKVWVCSNGFLSFNTSVINPTPESIPNVNQPNATVAPFWRDLELTAGGSITYGYIGSSPYGSLFVISWNGIPNKGNRVPQTFQAVICRSVSGGYGWYHNRIIFQYASITKDYATTVGIEDVFGAKGTSYDYHQLSDHMALVFIYDSMGYRLEQLKIKLAKSYSDNNAGIDFIRSSIGGYNVELSSTEDGMRDFYTSAIEFGAGMLVAGIGGATAGVVFGGLVVLGHGAAAQLSAGLSEPVFQVQDASRNMSEAYVGAPSQTEQYFLTGPNPFDSTLAATVEWSFFDPNSEDHTLTITVEATYKEVGETTPHIVTTSTTLSMYHQHQLTIACGSSGTTDPAPGTYSYTHGSSVTVTAIPNPNYALSFWLLDGQIHYREENPITFTMDFDHFLSAAWEWTGGPFGGCPYVSTWNGTQWLLDNNLIPAAERSNGNDVTDYYKIQQPLAWQDGRYPVQIWDLDKHSFLDRVRLLAVDHQSDVNIAVSPYGEVLTYQNPTPPVLALNRSDGDVTNYVSMMDDNYVEGYAGDYLELDFGNLDVSAGAKLVLRTDPPCEIWPCEIKDSIHVQVVNSTGSWADVASFIPRIYWSIDIINLSSYLPDINGNLKARLYFTAHHKVDYVGLDTTEQGNIELTYASLAQATHSQLGDVKELFQQSDNLRVELLPGEQVTLTFTLPQNNKQKRDFIMILEGHYFIPS